LRARGFCKDKIDSDVINDFMQTTMREPVISSSLALFQCMKIVRDPFSTWLRSRCCLDLFGAKFKSAASRNTPKPFAREQQLALRAIPVVTLRRD
jgi:hypothetical protein